MRKKWQALVVGALLLCPLAVGAYNENAPNSFDEVERKRDSFRIAATLIDNGLAPGYDESFTQRPRLSRYEFAQGLKALLENRARLTPRQWDALAVSRKEYSRELAALGYEGERRRGGGIEVGGDVRLRHRDGERNSKTDSRLRIQVDYETEQQPEPSKEAGATPQPKPVKPVPETENNEDEAQK